MKVKNDPKKISMATRDGGYVVVYIMFINIFYSGQSLIDGNRCRLRSGTLVLNSSSNMCMISYSLHKYTHLLLLNYWVFLGAFSRTQANLLAKV